MGSEPGNYLMQMQMEGLVQEMFVTFPNILICI